jgi:hypothetical protein
LGLTDKQVVEVRRHSDAEISAALEYAQAPGRDNATGSFIWSLRNPASSAAKKKVDPPRPNAAAYDRKPVGIIGLHKGPTKNGSALAAKTQAELAAKLMGRQE